MYLEQINGPEDVKKLSGEQLTQLAADAAAGIERREGENLCIHRKTQVILNRKLLK